VLFGGERADIRIDITHYPTGSSTLGIEIHNEEHRSECSLLTQADLHELSSLNVYTIKGFGHLTQEGKELTEYGSALLCN